MYYTLILSPVIIALLIGVLKTNEDTISREIRVEVENAGRFEVTLTEYGWTYTVQGLGKYETRIRSYTKDHREVILHAQKLDKGTVPLFVYVKNPSGGIMYTEITTEPYGDLYLLIHNKCEICHG